MVARNELMARDLKNKDTTNEAGLTILEVLIVLSIITLIAAVSAPKLIGYLGKAKSETGALQIKQLRNATDLFYIDTGRYPTDSEGLQALVNAPSGATSWSGPYMPNVDALIDPWGRDYVYSEPSTSAGYTISSLGRDGAKGGTGEDQDLIN
jgi:general secretion pathway protein G